MGVDFEPDNELFLDALAILRDVHRFWTQVEKDVGTFEEYGDINIDDVISGPIAFLSKCIEAYDEGCACSFRGARACEYDADMDEGTARFCCEALYGR